MRDKYIGVYRAEDLPGNVEVGDILTPGSGMPWKGAYNPRPTAPLTTGPRSKKWRRVKNKVWVKCTMGVGCTVIRIGGEDIPEL